jgi:hypothetical protein
MALYTAFQTVSVECPSYTCLDYSIIIIIIIIIIVVVVVVVIIIY